MWFPILLPLATAGVAEGEALSFSQEDLNINGHAIEARLYAEDPQNGFLPSPGKVVVWQPSTVGDARFDSGVETGSEISTEFDPMIAKVIVHAPTRREAASRLARVLETTRIQGLTTNRDFLVATLRTPEYLAGDTTTDFIERVQPALAREVTSAELCDAVIATVMESQARNRATARVVADLPSGWRNSTMPPERMSFDCEGTEVSVEYRSQRDGTFDVLVGDTRCSARPRACGNGQVDVEIDGRRVGAAIERTGDTWLVQTDTVGLALKQLPRYPSAAGEDHGGGLMAPMPGAVLNTAVAAGDTVEKGQLLLILEAMKMEHRISAPQDGVVEAVHVQEGDQVENGQLLVTIADVGGE